MSERKKVSSEVAGLIGITRKNLTNYLDRYPELRPAERLPNGDFLWSEAEIEAVIKRRQRRNRKAE